MIIQIQKVILIFIRIVSFIVICPGFSLKALPNMFKIGLASAFTFLAYTMIPEMEFINSMWLFAFIVIKEALFGLGLGFVTDMVIGAIEMAGSFIDFQSGFSMGAVFDPSTGIRASNYGRLYYWLSLSVFFILNMHHKVIEALLDSFRYVPLGTMSYNGDIVYAVISIFSRVFELAINLAAPIIVVALVTDVVLGVISRTIPQINVLILGMPLKILISFFIVMLSLSWIMNAMGNIISLMPGYMEGIMKLYDLTR